MKILLCFSLASILLSCNVVKTQAKLKEKALNRKDFQFEKYTTDSTTMFCWDNYRATDKVVLFIQGFGGNAISTWTKEMKKIGKQYRVIAPDLLWFGQSYSSASPNLSLQALTIEKILKQKGIDSLMIVGQSYGGFVTIELIRHSDLTIQKAIIANSPGVTFNQKHLDTVVQKFDLKNIQDLFIIKEAQEIQRLINAGSYSDKNIPSFLCKQIMNEHFNKHHTQLEQLMISLRSEGYTKEDINKLSSVKTLVLWGKEDEIFPFSEGKKYADTINAQFIAIKNCGHAPQIDQHKEFTNIIETFLSK